MARYTDWEDLVRFYPQAERSSSAREISSYHLSASEYKLEGMLAGGFTVPFSNNNHTARELVVDLAIVRLGVLQDEDAKSTEKRVMERIGRIAAGSEAMLVTIDGTLTPVFAGATAWSTTKGYHPVFGMGPIEDMVVDSSRICDEESARG